MRIVYLLGTAGGTKGGMERHTLDLAGAMAAQGMEVHLVADEAYRRFLPPGVTFHALDMDRSRRSPWLWWQWRRVLKTLRPQVVHAQGAKAAALLSAQARWLRAEGCVAVGTVHGTKSSHKEYKALDAVIVVSSAIAARLQHPRVAVIPNGIAVRAADPAVLESCVRQRRQMSCSLVLAIGRLVPVKGFDTLLQAWPRESGAQLLILGDGPERAALQALIAQLGIEDSVKLGGHSDAVTEWLHCADAMIISSQREGFPYVLIEALQAGCPVLSTAVSGVAELLPPEVLAAPGDVPALRQLLLAQLPRLSLLRQEQTEIFTRARTEFTLDAMAGRTLELYQSLREASHD